MTCLLNGDSIESACIDSTAACQSTSEPLRALMDGMFVGDDIAACRIASFPSYLTGVVHALAGLQPDASRFQHVSATPLPRA